MRFTFLLGCVIAAFGCGDDADPRPGGQTGTEGSTGAATSSDASTSSTSIDGSTSGTDDADASQTADASTSGSTSTGSADDSTGTCPLGELGCPCDEGLCIDDLVCVGDLCESAMQCPPDATEPNEAEATAASLGEIDDLDSNGDSVSGVLDHDGDVDWYTYIGDDDAGSIVDPTRDVVATGSLRICKFVECLNGLPNTEITCPGSTDYALSPLGRPGCCDSQGFAVPDVNCTDVGEDSMAVYVRIDQPSAQCLQYTINYHY